MAPSAQDVQLRKNEFSMNQNLSSFIWSVADCCGVITGSRNMAGSFCPSSFWEAEIRQYENRQRPGRMDFKAMTLFRDGYRCRQCGSRVTIETSETDHIKPVHCFASFAQANHLFNLQTLCLQCHKLKHGAKPSRPSGKPDAGKACTSGLGLGPG